MTVDKLASGIIRWRWAIIALTFLIVGIIASGITNIGFSSNYRVFFSSDNEQLVAFETIQNTYSKSDNVLLVVEPHEGEVFTRDAQTRCPFFS